MTRLGALITGLGDAAHRGRLLPAAPRRVAESLSARVVGNIPGPLIAHPPAARSRRVTRAIAPPLGVAALAVLAGQPWVAYTCAALAVLAVPLGLDRYRQLGHASDGERLTVRSGSLRRRQVVVEHSAVVGWRIRRTLFQRRLGLATLRRRRRGRRRLLLGGHGGGGRGGPRHRDHPEWLTPFLAPTRDDGRRT